MFGAAAAEAGAQITGLDTTEFVGPEGDLFREGLNANMPRHLSITGDAFGRVARALSTFADTLGSLQERMRPVAARAFGLWEALQAAQGRMDRAAAADEAHRPDTASRPDGSSETYVSDSGAASASLSGARVEWDACVSEANGLRGELTTAVSAAVSAIGYAKDLRFKENPKWWDLGGQIQNFVRDNKDLLQKLSGALKIVSLVAGLLSFIPVLAPIMGPIALVAGAAALAIDVAIYASTGEGSLTNILIDTALTVIPGGRLLGVGKRLFSGAGRVTARAFSGASRGLGSLRSAVSRLPRPHLPMQLRPATGDPVDVATGQVLQFATDVDLPGVLPLVISRVYVSSYRSGCWFGPGWASTLDQRLEVDVDGVCYAAPDGALVAYPLPMDGGPVLPACGPQRPLVATETGYLITDDQLGWTLHFAEAVEPPAGDGDPGTVAWRLSSLGDRNGNRVDVRYDADGLITEVAHSGGYRLGVDTMDGVVTALRLLPPEGVRDGDGASSGEVLVRYGYDSAGNLVEIVNSSGQPMRFEYDIEGRMTGWQDRRGTRYEYTYDEWGRCVRGVGSDNRVSRTFSYASESTVEIDALGHTTVHHLNDRRQVVRVVNPLGHGTSYEWDEHDRKIAEIDALGRSTRFEYDEHGNLVRIVRPDGTDRRIAYNDLQIPVRVIDFDGSTWRWLHDRRGNMLSATDPLGATTNYAYDDRGHLCSVTDALGGVRWVDTDGAGLVVAVTDPLGAVTTYSRDASGRVTAVTDPLGAVTRLVWTVEGRLAERVLPDGASERWRYDGEGKLVQHTNPQGAVTAFEYAHFDLLAARSNPDGARTAFEYDAELRLTSVVNPEGATWRYEYDPAGNLIRETDFNGRVQAYTLDAVGQLAARTNGAGEMTSYTRDLLGNVVEQRSADSVTTFEYDPLGRLIRARNNTAELVFARDAAGRITSETCNGRSVTSVYDRLGRRIRRITPSGVESFWEYDAADRHAVLHTAGQTLRFAYDAAGREIERQVGAGLSMARTWDTNSRLQTLTLTAGSTGAASNARPVQRRSYEYRSDGYVIGISDLLTGDRRVELDAVGRVSTVSGDGWAERYAYGSAGSITDAAWSAGAASETQGPREYAGTLIRRAGRVRYEHDAQGRVVLRQRKCRSAKPETWRYTWNADDRLIAVTTPDGQRWRYQYDPLGRRIAKLRLAADGGDTVAERIDFAWDGVVLAEQVEDRHSMVWDWEPWSFRPISQVKRSALRDAPQAEIDERFYAIVTDLVGRPTELVTPDGQLAWQSKATIWGTDTGITNGDLDCPLRFPGQYRDRETGDHYNFYRYYDPETGRYLSGDPLGLDGGESPHEYVLNPLGWLDPLGLIGCLTQMASSGERAADSAKAAKAGLTHAGRKYQQHMMQGHLPHLPSQSPDILNQAGREMLENVLTDPLSSVVSAGGKTNFPGGYHVVSNIVSPGGDGFISVLFDANHVFQFFGVIH
jgi:RHS repeat-associated protein